MGIMVIANTFISNTGDSTFSSNIVIDGGNLTLALTDRIILSGDSSKWHYQNGSSIDFLLTTTDAKPYLGWYDLYTDPSDKVLVAWMGAHQSNNVGGQHNHFEIETLDTDIGFVQGKLIVSYNTTRADSFVQVTNVGKFKLGASVDVQFANGEEIQSGGAENGLILFGGNQTTYGLKIKNVSDMVELVGFGAPEIRINSDLNVVDNHIYLNNTNNPLIEIERDDTATDASLAFTTGGTRRWSLMLDDDGTDDLYIRNNNAGKMAITINDSLNFNINHGNLTLMDKITFRFGQIIDNIIDGWITITGGLKVTGESNFTNVTAEKINEVLYVMAGNGSDIQAKIDMCPDGGCEIIIPKGTYLIDNQINITKKGIRLIGHSRSGDRIAPEFSTLIQASNGFSGGDMISITNHSVDISNLWINGTTSTTHGIAGYLGGSYYLHDLMITKQGDSGIYFNDTMDSDNTIFRVSVNLNGNNGIWLKRADNHVSNVFAKNNSYSAIKLEPGSGTQINFLHAYQNNHSIYLNGTDNTNILNSILESNIRSAIYFDSTHSVLNGIQVMGNSFFLNDFNSEGHPVYFFDSESTNIIDDINIIGNNYDGTAILINYTGTDITDLNFPYNNHESDSLGNIPAGFSNALYTNVQGGNQTIKILRKNSETEKGEYYIDDSDFVFISEQDEDTSINGGFRFVMDDDGSAIPSFLIETKSGQDIIKVSNSSDLIIGDGTTAKNITLTSPDGTEFTCGVNNTGSFNCN